MQSFFEFLVSVINHYHINGWHVFGDSLEWLCRQISSEVKYFFLSCSRHCNQGFIVDIVYYFQIWNKKEHNIIISIVISSHIGPMYIETPNMGPIFIETPYIGHVYIETPYMGSMFIETPYIDPMYIETPYIGPMFIQTSYMGLMYIETHCIYSQNYPDDPVGSFWLF